MRGSCSWVNAMKYDPKIHHRRSIRLVDYDYAQAGAYFVTVCAEDHLCLFGNVRDGDMWLNDAGEMVQATWDQIPDRYPAVETDAFVVMPNHIHAIIVLSVGAGPCACPDPIGQPRGVAPTDGRGLSLGDVVQRFKTLTTKRYVDGVKQHGWRVFPGRLWQRNYFEHIIRNDHALDQIRLYIMNNPANWMLDRENPEAECYGRDEGQP